MPRSIRRKANTPGAAGAFSGTRRRANTCCNAAPPTPNGDTQPLDPPWDNVGFGNNAVHRVHVTVR